MIVEISAADMAVYKKSARLREARQQQANIERRAAAWIIARQAAALLKAEFGADSVLVYGSVVHGYWFGPASDIDLAVVGLPAEKFWRAWAALDPLSGNFVINLVAMETVTATLQTMIEREGVAL